MNLRRVWALLFLSLVTACGGLRSTIGDAGPGAGGCNTSVTGMHHLADGPADSPLLPQSLAFDSHDKLYALSPKWINVYSDLSASPHIDTLGVGKLHAAQDLAIDPNDDTIWVVDFDEDTDDSPTVFHFDAQGAVLTQWQAGLIYGNAILVQPSGAVLIGASLIDRFTPDGGFDGGFGDEFPNIPFTSGLAADSKGNIWAADPLHNEVREFTSALEQVASFGSRGTGAGMFDGNGAPDDPELHEGPNSIAIDKNDDLYVNDPLNSRIMKLSHQGGTMTGQFSFGGSDQVGALAVDPKTGVIVVGRGNAVDLICPL